MLIYHVSNERKAGSLRETESHWGMKKERDGELIWGQGQVSTGLKIRVVESGGTAFYGEKDGSFNI